MQHSFKKEKQAKFNRLPKLLEKRSQKINVFNVLTHKFSRFKVLQIIRGRGATKEWDSYGMLQKHQLELLRKNVIASWLFKNDLLLYIYYVFKVRKKGDCIMTCLFF